VSKSLNNSVPPPPTTNHQPTQVAAIYDIHGNLPALEAVLEQIHAASVDHIVVGGDVVPGPMAQETLACLAELKIPTSFIQGNGEVAGLEDLAGTFAGALPAQARASIHASAQAMTPEAAATLASWPMMVTLTVDGIGDVLFCHGTPRHHNEIFTAATSEEALLPVFDAVNVSVVICGHTHMPFDRMVGRTRVVNAGSVGLPIGHPGADWLLLGPDIHPQHTNYDRDAAAARIRQTRSIDANTFAQQILEPASAEQMIATFTRAQLRYGE
jgi:predicted phosphodiesterase